MFRQVICYLSRQVAGWKSTVAVTSQDVQNISLQHRAVPSLLAAALPEGMPADRRGSMIRDSCRRRRGSGVCPAPVLQVTCGSVPGACNAFDCSLAAGLPLQHEM